MKKFLVKLAEQYVDRFYEGIEVPKRLFDAIDEFKRMCPNPSSQEWEAFAKGYSARCWREGFTRGFENAERDPHAREQWKKLPPDMIADREDPSWRESPAFDPNKSPEETEDMGAGRSLDDMMIGRSRL